MNFEVHMLAKLYGPDERIRLNLAENETSVASPQGVYFSSVFVFISTTLILQDVSIGSMLASA